jgi:hypothetical protein
MPTYEEVEPMRSNPRQGHLATRKTMIGDDPDSLSGRSVPKTAFPTFLIGSVQS